MSKNNVTNDLEFSFKAGSLVNESTLLEKRGHSIILFVNGHINTEDLREDTSKSDTYMIIWLKKRMKL